MHKYYVRLLIDEEKKTVPGEPKQPPKPILSIEFPETTFIAVTAYQNEEVRYHSVTLLSTVIMICFSLR